MRMRTWIFAAVVAVVLAINLGLVSLRIAQTGEETLRGRVALASNALRGQLDLLDARLAPRAIAASPDVIESTKPSGDSAGKPDERALRAAAAAVQPEPDLLAVAGPQGAIVSRRARALQSLDDPGKLPLAKAGLEGTPPPSFAVLDGALYRVAAARVPGNAAVVISGALVDDRLTAQLRSQIDADVTLIQSGRPFASSLSAEERARVARWAQSPAPGYGVLQVRLPFVGSALSGMLPRGATRYAVRGALVALEGGVLAAITVPASPYLGWLGRYQAFYLAALVLLLLFGFVWGLLPARAAPSAAREAAPPPPAPEPSLDVGSPRSVTPAPGRRDVPWREGEGPSGEFPLVGSQPPRAAPAPFGPPGLDDARPATRNAPPPGAPAIEPPLPRGSSAPVEGELFSPTPGQFATVSEGDTSAPASAAAGRDGAAAGASRPATPQDKGPGRAAAVGGKGDFTFAGLLDEAHAAPVPPLAPGPSTASAWDAPPPASSQPPPAVSAEAAGGFSQPSQPRAVFPGDEPTRIEPVSAALLDKLREMDAPPEDAAWPPPAPVHAGAPGTRDSGAEAATTAAAQGAQAAPAWDADWGQPAAGVAAPPAPVNGAATPGSRAAEGGPVVAAAHGGSVVAAAQPPAADAAPAKDVTMTDFSLPPLAQRDPDEAHWQDTFEQFRALKTALGEPADRITFEKFSAKLRKNREDLLARHNCKGVRFSVYEKDGKAAIKASAIRS